MASSLYSVNNSMATSCIWPVRLLSLKAHHLRHFGACLKMYSVDQKTRPLCFTLHLRNAWTNVRYEMYTKAQNSSKYDTKLLGLLLPAANAVTGVIKCWKTYKRHNGVVSLMTNQALYQTSLKYVSMKIKDDQCFKMITVDEFCQLTLSFPYSFKYTY